MTLLHALFQTRNQRAFQRRLLEAGPNEQSAGLSTSAGKSWSKANAILSEVNARDWLGRTVLHLAVVSTDTLEYVKLLLRHPAININLQDTESHWTALHRALYNGNLSAAVLLLQRSDIDISIKDLEGNTAFDCLNSSIHGTQPESGPFPRGELYTWGTNRNAALGHGDSDDRIYPDQIAIPSKQDNPAQPIATRFSPVFAKDMQMSKLHTAIITSESTSNVHVCGFGNGGRLGPIQHTQYSLTPVNCSVKIVSVSLGQDHTLALSDNGEIFSWGLNRFGQLGYTVESGKLEEPIQSFPRKIVGPLKKELVKGVSASKSSSACWTETSVFTWGKNFGQLGYDKAAHPIQPIPRKVTKIAKPVISLCLSDSTLACLLVTKDVFCICNDRAFKINFPTNVFPSEVQVYRPPQAVKSTEIAAVKSNDDTFAALSSNGELFTFTVPCTSDPEGVNAKTFKPQRVWALRKQFSSVRDVAIGSEGSIIICTQSGHVFVRSRNVSGRSLAGGAASSPGNKTSKFQRVPYLQRVISVSANSTGAFGALKMSSTPPTIEIQGNTITEDLVAIQPHLSHFTPKAGVASYTDSDDSESAISRDIARLDFLCHVLLQGKGDNTSSSVPLTKGADVILQTKGGVTFSAHKVILSARSSVLYGLLSSADSRPALRSSDSTLSVRCLSGHPRKLSENQRIEFNGCHAMSLLILLHYLYSDDVLAPWDPRVSVALAAQFEKCRVNPSKVKLELQSLAQVLDLPALAQALLSPVKVVAAVSLVGDLKRLHSSLSSLQSGFSLRPDVILQFADKTVPAYSAILRARSMFFKSFFDEDDWTRKRRDESGVITMDFKHLRWHVMRYVVRYLCNGEDEEMFRVLDFVHSIEDVLEFMFDVISAANQLLLDRLVFTCSSIVLQFTNLSTVCYVLSEASHFHISPLVNAIQGYMVENLETLLEGHMLEMLDHSLVKQLSHFLQKRQVEKLPFVKSGSLVSQAMSAHEEWLSLQDIPEPIIPSDRQHARKTSPKLSLRRPSFPRSSLDGHRSRPEASGDDIFAMDGVDPIPSLSSTPKTESSVWKSTAKPRVDMRALMAEAAEPSHTVMSQASQTKVVEKASSYKPPSQRSRDPGGPWKVSAPSPGTSSVSTTPKDSSPATAPKQSHSSSPPKGPSGPGLGPVITPTRQMVSKAQTPPRRPAMKAWTSFAPAPIGASASTTGMPFVAIQQHQFEQGMASDKDKRSLLEIQEEEQSRRQEEEFMKWWAAEEERIRLESQAITPSQARPKNTKRSKWKGPKRGAE